MKRKGGLDLLAAQGDKKVFCNVPCDSMTCPHSMYAVPTDGTEVILDDMSNTPECEKGDRNE